MNSGRAWTVRCTDCDAAAPDWVRSETCRACGGVLLAALVSPTHVEEAAAGLWSAAGLLPSTAARVSLGEGGTPLLLAAGIDDRLWLKLESLNPTLSFKDRGMALAASIAIDFGLQRLVLASTGNAAVSAAAYAAAAGLGCTVVVGSASDAARKLHSCHAYGAEVVEVDGDYSTAYASASALGADGALVVTTTYRNPVLAEAYRGMAAEIVAQGRFDVVIVPIGAGPLLRALGEGFADLVALGRLEHAPRLVGVQAAGVAPLAAAWRAGLHAADPERAWRESMTRGVVAQPTAATAIADSLRGYEAQGLLTLRAVAASGGAVVAVDEPAIAAAAGDLRRAGHWVEPSSATTLAAVRAHPSILGADERAALVLTGHGIKAVAGA